MRLRTMNTVHPTHKCCGNHLSINNETNSAFIVPCTILTSKKTSRSVWCFTNNNTTDSCLELFAAKESCHS